MVDHEGRFPAGKLAEWHRRHRAEAKWLDALVRRSGPNARISEEDSWRLYALSRVLEVLNLTFQRGDADLWPGPGLSQDEASSFARDLGLSVTSPDRYTAFDCEVVKVIEAGDDGEEARLVELHWPSIMLGDMMVCRAGATVRAGSRVMNPAIAATSTLYWAYRRRNRPHQDLSHGWGHNSQWRTALRRDYRTAARTYYNVDGRCDLTAANLPVDEGSPLSRAERVELLVNRCFIVTTRPCDDLWPYDDCLVVRAGA